MSTEQATDTALVPLPAGVTLSVGKGRLRAKGPKGTIDRPFPHEALKLTVEGGAARLTLQIPPDRKRSKALLHTWEAHVRNLAVGVTQGFEARMKVVAAHFPMKVAVKESRLMVENFLGEKYPRSALLLPGVEAKVDGDHVVLTGIDIERVGQSAANIERTTRIRDYDPRVFQDGIYIVERARPIGGD